MYVSDVYIDYMRGLKDIIYAGKFMKCFAMRQMYSENRPSNSSGSEECRRDVPILYLFIVLCVSSAVRSFVKRFDLLTNT